MRRKEIAKKLGITIMASLLALPCVVPVACPPDTKVLAAQTDTKSPSQGLQLTTKTYEKEYKTEEGRIYKEVSYEYPYAEDDSDAAKTFNRFYRNLLTKWKKNAAENLKEAEDMIKETDSADNYYADDVKCEVTINDENHICVLQSGYEYSMGAHGMPYRYSYIFDAKTGKKVSAATLLGMSKKQVNEKVRELYLKKFDKTKKVETPLFYPDRDDVKKALEQIDFNDNRYYLKNGKIRFYADPYAVGPYVSGFIEVAVKLS
uniref:Deacetylase PdaC domain-containing protein n=1 Tax=Eubacterium plexicaudatum ASF492 TaxID=1235802 RepID=N2ADQ2_9FIRM